MIELTQQRINFNDQIKNTLFLSQYKENPIKLVGSSSLQAQKYFGDYDALTYIKKKERSKNIYEEFKNIFKKTGSDPNLYFIEFKIQTKNNKFKYYKNDKFDFKTLNNNFDETEFYKLDLSMWYEFQFVDVSIIYILVDEYLEIEKKEEINNLKVDIKNLEKEGKYYKMLKRQFSIYRLKNDKNKMLELTNIFNSDLGLKYKVASNIEAINLVQHHYKDDLTKKRIKINLDFLNLNKYNFKDLVKQAEKMKDEINNKAKKFINKYIE